MQKTNQIRRRLAAGILTLSLTLAAASPALAQFAVFDPANFAESIVNAYHTLQSNVNQATQIANQVQGLGNQIQMLQNEGKNLASLNTNLVGNYRTRLSQLMDQVGQVKGLMSNINGLGDRFKQEYPNTYSQNPTWQAVQQMNQKWRTDDLANMQGSLATGGRVLQQLPSSQADIARLGQDSASATGALSAIQAGNQLSMNIAGQMQSLNAQTAVYQQAVIQHMAANASGVAASDAENAALLSGFSSSAPPKIKHTSANDNFAPWGH